MCKTFILIYLQLSKSRLRKRCLKCLKVSSLCRLNTLIPIKEVNNNPNSLNNPIQVCSNQARSNPRSETTQYLKSRTRRKLRKSGSLARWLKSSVTKSELIKRHSLLHWELNRKRQLVPISRTKGFPTDCQPRLISKWILVSILERLLY